MKILKFGGTSVADAARRAAVAEIVSRTAGDVTVVTSALGGVTDLLAASLDEAVAGRPHVHLDEIRRRHRDAALPPAIRREVDARLVALNALLSGVALLGECPEATRHQVLAAGERLAVLLVTEALRRAGLPASSVDAAELLVAPGGVVDARASEERVRRHWQERRGVTVVPGFVAGDGRGGTTTLGRGASDLTATLLGRFLDAERVEIWTDVDGILSAPPNLVPEAFPLPRLSYGEAAALARFGARVLHPETLAPVAEARIPVWVRNTLRPAVPGTRICEKQDGEPLDAPPGIRALSLAEDGSSLMILAAVGGRRLQASALLAALEQAGVEPRSLTATCGQDDAGTAVTTASVDIADAHHALAVAHRQLLLVPAALAA